MSAIRWVTETELLDAFGYARGIDAINQTLSRGFDPAQDKKRMILDFSSGQGLVMPSEEGKFAGLKFFQKQTHLFNSNEFLHFSLLQHWYYPT